MVASPSLLSTLPSFPPGRREIPPSFLNIFARSDNAPGSSVDFCPYPQPGSRNSHECFQSRCELTNIARDQTNTTQMFVSSAMMWCEASRVPRVARPNGPLTIHDQEEQSRRYLTPILLSFGPLCAVLEGMCSGRGFEAALSTAINTLSAAISTHSRATSFTATDEGKWASSTVDVAMTWPLARSK